MYACVRTNKNQIAKTNGSKGNEKKTVPYGLAVCLCMQCVQLSGRAVEGNSITAKLHHTKSRLITITQSLASKKENNNERRAACMRSSCTFIHKFYGSFLLFRVCFADGMALYSEILW